MTVERYVIAIAGPVGAGKSTLANRLQKALADSTCIRFDDYEQVTRQPIEKIRRWMENGADMDEMQIPGLAEDLLALKQGRAVCNPLTRDGTPAVRYILFETQFGRRHVVTGQHIDLLVWVDTPLDLALARKIRQFIEKLDGRDPDAARSFASWLHQYLGSYLGVVGDLLRIQRDTVGADADIVIDGTRDPAALQQEVVLAIRARLG